MSKSRLEAFSDGVLAIVITIMVLELHPPEEASLAAFVPLLPKFFGYILSFIYVGIYWNNHHHLLQATKSVNGSILWANMHLLFWLSLIPFTTSWMGEHFETIPVAFYGIVLWLAGFAYYILVRFLISHHGQDSVLANAIGSDKKGIRSLYIYTTAVIVSFFSPAIAAGLYVVVAIMWLIPDRRIEDKIK
jgi:uncharacterized membrane protein